MNETKDLQTTDKGQMEFTPYGSPDSIKLSIHIVKTLLCKPTRSGQLCSDQDAMKFMMLCRAKRLNPFENDAYLVGYDGKSGPEFSLITAHQAFLKRAELHPEYDGMESGIVCKKESGQTIELSGEILPDDCELIGAWATVFFKNRKIPMKKKLPLAAYVKPTPFWEGAKASGQICKCAEADALRSAFPTMLGGLYMADEVSLDVSSPKSRNVDEGLVKVLERTRVANGTAPAMTENDLAEADAGLAPATAPLAGSTHEAGGQRTRQPSLAPAEGNEASLQAALEKLVTEPGFTFQQFVTWADGSGVVPDATSYASFEDVPNEICKRLLRAKTGMLKGLEMAKEAK